MASLRIRESVQRSNCIECDIQITCLLTQVILGGGRQYMMPETMQDPEYLNRTGVRKDGLNLIVEWIKNKEVQFIRVVFRFVFRYE